MSENPLRALEQLGQSIWVDYIQRKMLDDGALKRLIEDDGVSGVTSNPSIFEKAIVEHRDYDDAIRTLHGQRATAIYERLALEDLQRAADLFRPLYESQQGRDGFVSLEVSPHLAYDADATIEEARRLWSELARPNGLIKVPATRPGLQAIRQLISEGINVNVTLLFSIGRYREVADAYLSGLEARLVQGGAVDRVASVASFFLSRIDTLADAWLDALAKRHPEKGEAAMQLRGKVAIASARLAYQDYKAMFSGERWQHLAAKGAMPQRLLWASTSTKDPDYSDIKYVDALIGVDTVNTLPPVTLDDYRDHGAPAQRLETGIDDAQRVLDELDQLGIDLQALTDQLEQEGVDKFIHAYDKLMKSLAGHSEAVT
ncbi:MAG TPA: transaldolase [Mariprofundaceae bacterium]|nr:transaldolase [Mariprofundaceae bacterium]